MSQERENYSSLCDKQVILRYQLLKLHLLLKELVSRYCKHQAGHILIALSEITTAILTPVKYIVCLICF